MATGAAAPHPWRLTMTDWRNTVKFAVLDKLSGQGNITIQGSGTNRGKANQLFLVE